MTSILLRTNGIVTALLSTKQRKIHDYYMTRRLTHRLIFVRADEHAQRAHALKTQLGLFDIIKFRDWQYYNLPVHIRFTVYSTHINTAGWRAHTQHGHYKRTGVRKPVFHYYNINTCVRLLLCTSDIILINGRSYSLCLGKLAQARGLIFPPGAENNYRSLDCFSIRTRNFSEHLLHG